MLASDIVSVETLLPLIGTDRQPVIVDVRRAAVFNAATHVLPAARRGLHTEILPADIGNAAHGVVIYCVHGHNVSQLAVARLRSSGLAAAQLAGGIEAWQAAGGPLIARAPDAAARYGAGTVWVTRRRPKIDRIACPWFIRRFVDDRAQFFFVDADQVLPVAEELGAIAFDVEGAPITHCGGECSFDMLLDRYAVTDPALRALARIVRGADTGALDLAREAAGLLSLSLGLSVLEADDQALLMRGFWLYDALYAYLRYAREETHGWPPRAGHSANRGAA